MLHVALEPAILFFSYGELADEYGDNDYKEEEVGEVKRKAPNKTIRNYASHYKGSHEGNARETSGHTRGGYGHTRNTLKVYSQSMFVQL